MKHELTFNELIMLDALAYFSQLSDGYDITDDAYQLLCISKNVSGRRKPSACLLFRSVQRMDALFMSSFISVPLI